MPPRGRGGRGGTAATAAGGGRTSSRIAEKQEAAQQAEREAAANTPNEPPAETSTPPPAPSRGRGRGRPRGTAAESYARRGTTRGNRGASSLASFRGRSTPKTVGYLGANEGGEESEIQFRFRRSCHTDCTQKNPLLPSAPTRLIWSMAIIGVRPRSSLQGPAMMQQPI